MTERESLSLGNVFWVRWIAACLFGLFFGHLLSANLPTSNLEARPSPETAGFFTPEDHHAITAVAQSTDTATDRKANPARFRFAPLPHVASPASLKIAYTGTTTPNGPAAFSSYGLLSIAVSRDGKYLTVAQPYSEDKQLPIFDARTGQIVGRADGWYTGPACAIGLFGMDDHERRNQTKDAQGTPLGGWHHAVLTARNNDAVYGYGVFFGGLALSDGTTTGGLGAGNSWNEDRPGGESLLVQDRPIVDIALCREDSVIIFADATPNAPALLLFDRARPFAPKEKLNFDRSRPNTLMRFNRSVPLPAAPLRVSALPDGSDAWVILSAGGKRQIARINLVTGNRQVSIPVTGGFVPEDLAVSPSGVLAVADSGPARNIRLFDAKTGKARGTFGTPGGALAPGSDKGQIRATGAFFAPRALDIDGLGNIYVLDSVMNGLAPRILKFKPNASKTNWDTSGALWQAQAQVIGAALVFDHTTPGRTFGKGLESEVQLTGDDVGKWAPKRLIGPFGQSSWQSLPSNLPESQIPVQESGAVMVGGKRFVVAWDDSDRFALTAAAPTDGNLPYIARPCLLLTKDGAWRDTDNDGRLEALPADSLTPGVTDSLPDVLKPGKYTTHYTGYIRMDLADASLWVWDTKAPSRVWRFPCTGLGADGIPEWNWKAGQAITIPGLVLQQYAQGPEDFLPVRDAAGQALYVYSSEKGSPDTDYYLRRYVIDTKASTSSLSWAYHLGPYRTSGRDQFMHAIANSGVDGPMNRPVGFAVPQGGAKYLFLVYNTGLQVEAVDVATGKGVALLRDKTTGPIWADTATAVQALYLPKSRTRKKDTYFVAVTDNFRSHTILYQWAP